MTTHTQNTIISFTHHYYSPIQFDFFLFDALFESRIIRDTENFVIKHWFRIFAFFALTHSLCTTIVSIHMCIYYKLPLVLLHLRDTFSLPPTTQSYPSMINLYSKYQTTYLMCRLLRSLKTRNHNGN